MKTELHYSPDESEILGLKVGRCNTSFFNERELSGQILAGSFDVCRLKIASEDEFAVQKLERMGLPYFFSGSIRRYKTRIIERPPGGFLHPQMFYEPYDGSQKKLLRKMIAGTWGDYPLGYYRSPLLSHLATKEQEIDCLLQFYSRENLVTNNPNNTILFMKDGDQYVGFFALNIIEGNLESHIGGILEPYRKEGYFLDMLRYIKNYCIDHSLPYFLFGARNENAYVQKIFQEQGFISIGTENVFHLTPMLSFFLERNIIHEFTVSGSLLYLGLSFFEETYPKKVISKLSYKIWDNNRESSKLTAELRALGKSHNEEFFLICLKNADQVHHAVFYFKISTVR